MGLQVVITFRTYQSYLTFILLTLILDDEKIRQDGYSYYEDCFKETFLFTDW